MHFSSLKMVTWPYDIDYILISEHCQVPLFFGLEKPTVSLCNCYDNCIMETFFGRLKNEMLYGSEKEYASFESFTAAMDEFIDYYNNRRSQAKTNWMHP